MMNLFVVAINNDFIICLLAELLMILKDVPSQILHQRRFTTLSKSMMKLLCENSYYSFYPPTAFKEKAPSQIFDRILNTPLFTSNIASKLTSVILKNHKTYEHTERFETCFSFKYLKTTNPNY